MRVIRLTTGERNRPGIAAVDSLPIRGHYAHDSEREAASRNIRHDRVKQHLTQLRGAANDSPRGVRQSQARRLGCATERSPTRNARWSMQDSALSGIGDAIKDRARR